MTDRIFPCLLLPGRAEEAVDFYVARLPGGRILHKVEAAPGAVLSIEFELDGRLFLVLNAGPDQPPSARLSLVLSCADQGEIDRAWEALGSDGGAPGLCGWITDRFGVAWQVVPDRLPALLADPARGPRVFQAMIRMQKLDLAALEAA